MPFDQAKNDLQEALGNDRSQRFIHFSKIPVPTAAVWRVLAASVTNGEKRSVRAAVKGRSIQRLILPE
ncbi:hypothetical protein PGT21_007456 [Puccinia graminis f. sp. tritici]|uniref:Uncharacterized protein n=1 Tax=Puccinia graminis f. sp. tritici TaxID=56615 RepID=A0A5B0MK68_PUCGR|nr:hypothetical protein PGT21_007456 [Puccinia graminis f. sp. tritici]KAA1135517.1 hypothetical protein PGTUg99_011019 [Puccinia graminis f. sp. tritici]